jgi:carboxypeptidase Taq
MAARRSQNGNGGGPKPTVKTGNPPKALADLKNRLAEVSDLNRAVAVLNWDQATYMPSGGAAARGRQQATLARIAHERFIDAKVGRLLDALIAYADTLEPDSDEAALIRVTRRDFELGRKLPAAFVAEWRAASADSYQAWTKARPENDFSAVADHLARILDYSRRCSVLMGYGEHIADPLIDSADEGLTVKSVRALFDTLRVELVPLVKAITACPVTDDSCLKRNFPEARQLEFGLALARQFGFDVERGRQDRSPHPFCTTFAVGDVRITTRVKENDLTESLFSTLHEAGHAMYEQGIDPALEGTPLAAGVSAGVHESQSRLWENIVGRSRGFWQHQYPRLRAAFPGVLDDVPLEAFHRAINKVARSLVRTDADELTYNLHVMLRFDFEVALLEGKLAIRDLPEAWNERMRGDLGIAPTDDRYGVLQDVHWYAGCIGGAFQGYTVGNILSAQFYNAAVEAHPEVPAEIASGRYATLHGWLKQSLHRHGRKFTPEDVVARATGKPMTVAPYIAYLKEKYGGLYGRG